MLLGLACRSLLPLGLPGLFVPPCEVPANNSVIGASRDKNRVSPVESWVLRQASQEPKRSQTASAVYGDRAERYSRQRVAYHQRWPSQSPFQSDLSPFRSEPPTQLSSRPNQRASSAATPTQLPTRCSLAQPATGPNAQPNNIAAVSTCCPSCKGATIVGSHRQGGRFKQRLHGGFVRCMGENKSGPTH